MTKDKTCDPCGVQETIWFNTSPTWQHVVLLANIFGAGQPS